MAITKYIIETNGDFPMDQYKSVVGCFGSLFGQSQDYAFLFSSDILRNIRIIEFYKADENSQAIVRVIWPLEDKGGHKEL